MNGIVDFHDMVPRADGKGVKPKFWPQVNRDELQRLNVWYKEPDVKLTTKEEENQANVKDILASFHDVTLVEELVTKMLTGNNEYILYSAAPTTEIKTFFSRFLRDLFEDNVRNAGTRTDINMFIKGRTRETRAMIIHNHVATPNNRLISCLLQSDPTHIIIPVFLTWDNFHETPLCKTVRITGKTCSDPQNSMEMLTKLQTEFIRLIVDKMKNFTVPQPTIESKVDALIRENERTQHMLREIILESGNSVF